MLSGYRVDSGFIFQAQIYGVFEEKEKLMKEKSEKEQQLTRLKHINTTDHMVDVQVWINSFWKLKFVRVCSLAGGYFYNMYIVNMFEIVFSFNVKDTNIFPGLHNIRLSYNI